jgi:hypothetical protein
MPPPIVPNTLAVLARRRSAAARAGSVTIGTGSGLYFSSPFSRVNLIWNRFLLKNAVRSPTGVLTSRARTCDPTV